MHYLISSSPDPTRQVLKCLCPMLGDCAQNCDWENFSPTFSPSLGVQPGLPEGKEELAGHDATRAPRSRLSNSFFSIHTRMFIMALFIVTKNEKQSECS